MMRVLLHELRRRQDPTWVIGMFAADEHPHGAHQPAGARAAGDRRRRRSTARRSPQDAAADARRRAVEALRAFSTPTICNAIETFRRAARGPRGSWTASIACRFPELGRMAGYAVTAKIRASAPPERRHAHSRDLVASVRALTPKPWVSRHRRPRRSAAGRLVLGRGERQRIRGARRSRA